MFKFLGKIGKGWGTYTGLAVLIAGTVAGADAAQTVVGVSDAVVLGVQSIGGLLAAFGIGRKAGVHAFPELSREGKV